MNSLKIEFGLNHYKCTGHTSNKRGFLSPDIVIIFKCIGQKLSTQTTQDPYYLNSNVKMMRVLIK